MAEEIIKLEELTVPSEFGPLKAALLGRYKEELKKFVAILAQYKSISKDPAFLKIINESLVWVERYKIAPVPPLPPTTMPDTTTTHRTEPAPKTSVPTTKLAEALNVFLGLKQKLSLDMKNEAVLIGDEEKILKNLVDLSNALNSIANKMRKKVYDGAELRDIFSKILFSTGNFKSLSQKIKIYYSDIIDLINNHLNPLLRSTMVDKKIQDAVNKLDQSTKKLEGFMQGIINQETLIENSMNSLPNINIFITDAEEKESDPAKREGFIVNNAKNVSNFLAELKNLTEKKKDELKVFKAVINNYNKDTGKKLDDIGNMISR